MCSEGREERENIKVEEVSEWKITDRAKRREESTNG